MKYFCLAIFIFFLGCLNAQKIDTLCTVNGTPIYGTVTNISADFIYLTTLSGNDTKVPKDLIVKCTPEQLDSLKNGIALTPTVRVYNQDAPIIKFKNSHKQNGYLIKAGSFLAVSIAGTAFGGVLMGVGVAKANNGLIYAGAAIGGASFLLNIGTAANLIKAGKKYKYELQD